MKCLSFVLTLCGCALASDLLPDHPCVIVKHHVHKPGENMSRFHPHGAFDFVEGSYPDGFKWRSELGDGDVMEIQKRGGQVVVMKPDYALSDLEDARKQCRLEK